MIFDKYFNSKEWYKNFSQVFGSITDNFETLIENYKLVSSIVNSILVPKLFVKFYDYYFRLKYVENEIRAQKKVQEILKDIFETAYASLSTKHLVYKADKVLLSYNDKEFKGMCTEFHRIIRRITGIKFYESICDYFGGEENFLEYADYYLYLTFISDITSFSIKNSQETPKQQGDFDINNVVYKNISMNEF